MFIDSSINQAFEIVEVLLCRILDFLLFYLLSKTLIHMLSCKIFVFQRLGLWSKCLLYGMIHQFRALAINKVAKRIVDEVITVQIFSTECALMNLFFTFIFLRCFFRFALVLTHQKFTTATLHLFQHFWLSLFQFIFI